MSRRAVLATFGTLGDLHPFIALAVEMRKRGFDPVVATAAEYREKVETAGVPFFPVRPSFAQIEGDLGMNRPMITRRAIARVDFLFRKIVLPYVRQSYDDVAAVSRGADLMLTSSLGFGARLAAEKHGLDWLAIVLQPMMFFSAYDPPAIPHAGWAAAVLRQAGPAATARVFDVMKRLSSGVFEPVNDVRREIGLPRSRRHPLFEGQYSSAGVIGLYSPLLGAVQPDYPAPASIAGFAGLDAGGALDPALANWLDRGDPPLVFTLGSLIVNSPGAFFSESIAVARRLGLRCVLLAGEGFAAGFADRCGADLFVCEYAPHAAIFRRAAAIVHHGGIGTLAQAMRSGRPQLIAPFYADQIDNAARASRLGIARVLAPNRYRAARAARLLESLLGDAQVRRRAAEVGETLAREDGAAEACRLIG